MNTPLHRLAIAALVLAVAPLAHAGRSCERKAPQAIAVQRAMSLAANTARRLDDSSATSAPLVIR